ncbi:hypothetical protein LGL55_15655 [Clostridium tagluense]|uniref:hypothetical protein n=1 Tax=Clostridium tagluense TaxID=360422 RepID=UPI001CF25B24|nr:hypothetical protein [Clostridium tagluense]MCB2317478.1 hypothetical protein [Clostridium tagluense]MCB2322291.1 hypothetical protein [Clostridium tagluense]MCB2327295.1 hypothetical protein [Clostridium tagluense]MCB2331979.1 hypothetical protein [Clostridium tagluense]MCB2336910.1 hypothetical protein [Clostridium tagluense]
MTIIDYNLELYDLPGSAIVKSAKITGAMSKSLGNTSIELQNSSKGIAFWAYYFMCLNIKIKCCYNFKIYRSGVGQCLFHLAF